MIKMMIILLSSSFCRKKVNKIVYILMYAQPQAYLLSQVVVELVAVMNNYKYWYLPLCQHLAHI